MIYYLQGRDLFSFVWPAVGHEDKDLLRCSWWFKIEFGSVRNQATGESADEGAPFSFVGEGGGFNSNFNVKSGRETEEKIVICNWKSTLKADMIFRDAIAVPDLLGRYSTTHPVRLMGDFRFIPGMQGRQVSARVCEKAVL